MDLRKWAKGQPGALGVADGREGNMRARSDAAHRLSEKAASMAKNAKISKELRAAADAHEEAARAHDGTGNRMMADEERGEARKLRERADDQGDRAMTQNRARRVEKAKSLNENRDPRGTAWKRAGY